MSEALNQTNVEAVVETASAPRWNLTHMTVVTGVHVLCLPALYFLPRAVDIALFLGLYFVTCLGIGVGYHRLLTHRGFVCPRWLRRTLTWMGCAALQGGPTRWVSTHRRHHQKADREGDPHSPNEGFFHGHMGWLMRLGEQDTADHRKLAPDVSGDDPLMRVLDGGFLFIPMFIMPWVLTGVFCYAVAGWRGVL